MKILIVGAGIGGMALAALLRQRGIQVSLIERKRSLAEAGYMLTLYPMGSRVLHGLGIFDAFVKRSSEFRYYEVSNGHGEVLHRFDLTSLGESVGYTGQILRRDLLEILQSAAPDVPLLLNTGLKSIAEKGDKVVVTDTNGTVREFDGVVGADGIHSSTRQMVFGASPDTETGWGLWLWWGNFEDQPRNTVSEFWGRGHFLGVYPIPHRTGCLLAAPRSLIGRDVVGNDGAHIRRTFLEFGGRAADVLASFPNETSGLYYWNLEDQRAEQWTKGRVALLGDAACSFLPAAGVGASMAMESAAVLADELSRTDATFLPNALGLYEKRRKQRAEAAQKEARKLAAWLTTDSSAMAWTRDQFMKAASIDSLVGSIRKSLAEPL
jgi:2-polyprenyl-6-methoxyphenol hydroxylase-like FAD-dependent oxidoreductase